MSYTPVNGPQVVTGQPTYVAPPLAPPAGPKVAPTWIGVLLALGAVLAVVGTFLPYEKFRVLVSGHSAGTYTFTGVGTHSKTGHPGLGFVHAGNAGRIVLVMGVVLLLAAALVLAKKGRLWLGIISLLLAAVALVMGLASMAAPKTDAKNLNHLATGPVHVLAANQVGVTVAVAGAAVALLASLLAICVRRRHTV
jgi:hypothetical protein